MTVHELRRLNVSWSPTRGHPVTKDGPLPVGEWWLNRLTQGRTLRGITDEDEWWEIPVSEVTAFYVVNQDALF
jgi:hypothetical protein